jgi:hypothetical protein
MDGTLPLTTLSEVLEGTGLFDLVALETEAYPEGTWKVAYFDTSGLARRNGQPPKTEAAIVGRDPSSLSGGRFVLPLSEEEVASVAARLSIGRIRETAKELLRPEAVKRALKRRGLEVVPLVPLPLSEYRATRLSEEDLKAHKEAGGRTSTVDRGWGEPYEANLQFFRADLQGDVVVRQGDWFFLPVPEGLDLKSDLEVKRASSVDPGRLRRDVPDLGAHLMDRGDPLVSSGDCLFVRGLIRHARKDHHAVHLGDRWHRAVQADRQAVTAPYGGRSGGGDSSSPLEGIPSKGLRNSLSLRP